jgi:hypothetical protein
LKIPNFEQSEYSAELGHIRALAELLLAPAFCFTRYFIVVPRPLFAAALVVRRRYLIVVSRPLPASPLVVRCRYLIVVPRPLFAAALVVRHRYLIVVPRPMPAAPRRFLIVEPGRYPRRRSLCAADT